MNRIINNKYLLELRGSRNEIFGAFLTGIIIHINIISTSVTNPDVLWVEPYIAGHLREISLNRWGNIFLDFFKCNLVLPSLSVLMSLFLLTIIANLFMQIFAIKKSVYRWTVYLLMLSFPMVSQSLTYFYCFDNYCVAYLLAVISFLLVKDYDTSVIEICLSILFLIVSLAIYQSFIGITIALVFIQVYKMVFIHNEPICNTLSFCVKNIIVFVFSLTVYLVLSKIIRYCVGVDLADYRNMQTMLQVNLNNIFNAIIRMYHIFFQYFFGTEFYNNSWWGLNILNAICLTILVVLMLVRIKSLRKLMLLLCYIVIAPLFFSTIVLLARDTNVSYLMVPQMVLIYICLVAVIEKESFIQLNFLKICTVSVLLITTSKFVQLDNAIYLGISKQYEKTYVVSQSILNGLYKTDGYNTSTPIAIIGNIRAMKQNYDSEQLTEALNGTVGNVGYLWTNDYSTAQVSWFFFMQKKLGASVFFCVDEELLQAISQSNEFAQLNCFPNEGSIQFLNGVWVIKISE